MYGEKPDWITLYHQASDGKSIVPVWLDTTGITDFGKMKFNGLITIGQLSANRFNATILEIKEQMILYLTAVFMDKSGQITSGPIFSKYDIRGMSCILTLSLNGEFQI